MDYKIKSLCTSADHNGDQMSELPRTIKNKLYVKCMKRFIDYMLYFANIIWLYIALLICYNDHLEQSRGPHVSTGNRLGITGQEERIEFEKAVCCLHKTFEPFLIIA